MCILKACYHGPTGVDCIEQCGFCLNKSRCYSTNGTCFDGCDPGYTGGLCKTRMCKDGFFCSTKNDDKCRCKGHVF